MENAITTVKMEGDDDDDCCPPPRFDAADRPDDTETLTMLFVGCLALLCWR